MNWFVLVVISATCFSIATILQRVLMKEKSSNPVTHAFIFQFLVAVILFIFTIIFSSFSLAGIGDYLVNLVLLTVLYSAATLFLFRAYKLIQASEVAVLFSTLSVWVIFWSAIFLGETIGLTRITGTALIIAGVAAISSDGKKLKISRGYVYALVAALFFGAAFTNDAYMSNFFHVPSYITITFLMPSIAIILSQPKAISDVGFYFKKNRLSKLIAVCFFWGMAAITIFLAYQAGGDASQISPMSQMSVILTMAIAYALLKERDRMPQKILGAALVLIGVFVLR